jgi:hypothetical protein
MEGTSGSGLAEHFGKQLRRDRLSHGWSIAELARRMDGVNGAHLGRVEPCPPTHGRRSPHHFGSIAGSTYLTRCFLLTSNAPAGQLHRPRPSERPDSSLSCCVDALGQSADVPRADCGTS